jgi:UDP-N-acetylenolpyruvoylglucosamine reductase
MEGIPGNVGGALRMNAGAMGVETFDQVIEVTTLDEDGVVRTRRREEIEAGYRDVPLLRRCFALEAVFRGRPDTAAAIQSRFDESRAKRQASQPRSASAGCIFRNPATMPAGRLVEELGLKGAAAGGARISTMHGNFIVNAGAARAAEVLELIERIRTRARVERGIELQTEVKILGEAEPVF